MDGDAAQLHLSFPTLVQYTLAPWESCDCRVGVTKPYFARLDNRRSSKEKFTRRQKSFQPTILACLTRAKEILEVLVIDLNIADCDVILVLIT